MAEGGFKMDSFEPHDVDNKGESETTFSVGHIDDMSEPRSLGASRAALIKTKLDDLAKFLNMKEDQRSIFSLGLQHIRDLFLPSAYYPL